MKEVLSNPEWIIMEALWNKSPMFLADIMEALKEKLDWKRTTYSTYLKNMAARGLIGFDNVRGSRAYYPITGRRECVLNESRSLMARMGNDSAKLLLFNMVKEGDLSETDIKELKTLIDELESADKKTGKEA